MIGEVQVVQVGRDIMFYCVRSVLIVTLICEHIWSSNVFGVHHQCVLQIIQLPDIFRLSVEPSTESSISLVPLTSVWMCSLSYISWFWMATKMHYHRCTHVWVSKWRSQGSERTQMIQYINTMLREIRVMRKGLRILAKVIQIKICNSQLRV